MNELLVNVLFAALVTAGVGAELQLTRMFLREMKEDRRMDRDRRSSPRGPASEVDSSKARTSLFRFAVLMVPALFARATHAQSSIPQPAA